MHTCFSFPFRIKVYLNLFSLLPLSCTYLHFFHFIFLSVPPTPYVPVAKGCSNRKMRMAIRRHRALFRAGLRVGHVELPLPKEFVNVLKCSWPKRSYYGGSQFLIICYLLNKMQKSKRYHLNSYLGRKVVIVSPHDIFCI